MFPGHGGASLWSADGVGVIGGAPKVGKTWLALDIAVSVATGTPALGCFPVSQPGPVLLYGAEDAPADLRARLAAIAAARGLGLGDLDLGLIVALRALQRAYQLALALVLIHHLRKYVGARGADGQALRGSGDLHARGDSNLYLRRRDCQLVLSIEHRAAPVPLPCWLELATDPAPHLRVLAPEPAADLQAAADLADQIVTAPRDRPGATQPRRPPRRAADPQRHPRGRAHPPPRRGAHRALRGWFPPPPTGAERHSRTRSYSATGTERCELTPTAMIMLLPEQGWRRRAVQKRAFSRERQHFDSALFGSLLPMVSGGSHGGDVPAPVELTG